MHIAVITGVPFPIGLAPTNRIIAYCRGLVESGHSVDVFCVFPTEKAETAFNRSVRGTYEGISYQYTSGTCVKSTFKPRAWLDKQKGLAALCFQLLKHHRKAPYDAILITTYSTPVILRAKLLSILIKRPLILEKGEYPNFIRNDKRVSFSRLICERLIFRLFDGYLVITNALKAYFLDHLNIHKPVAILPICVDVERFCLNPPPKVKKQIAYCGSLNHQKDGIDDLLLAFRQIAAHNPDWTLAVYGGKPEQVETVHQKLCGMGLEKHVTLTGWIESSRIPQLLLTASILVLPRPASIQAEGGFPTKLGEYLVTGHPVIATAIGEIPSYLKDGDNAFLIPPSDASALADKIQYVIDHPQTAEQIGRNGRELAIRAFHYKQISQRMLDFIDSLRHPKDDGSD